MNPVPATPSKTQWGLFFLWPVLALFYALKNVRAKHSKNILWAFTVFYGFTFVISVDNANSDINRYVEGFKIMAESDIRFQQFLNSLYNVETRSADILQPLLTFIVSNFTNEPSVLIAVFAFVFGYFYSRNLWFVLDNLHGRMKGVTIFLLIVFALIIPVWYVNGFRFWTAAHIFFFGAFPYLLNGTKKGILIASLSVFVHFSFVLPVGILIIYFFLGTRLTIFFWFFLVSMFISELNIAYLDRLAEDTVPEVFAERTDSYTSELALEKFEKRTTINKNWYAVLYGKALRWSIVVLLIFLYIRNKKQIRQYASLLRLFSFTLFLYAVSNIMSLIPSGGRFITLATLFACSVIIFCVHYFSFDTVLKRIVYFLTPALLLFVIVNGRESLNSFGLLTIFSNPFIAMVAESKIALIDILKWR